MMRFLILSCLFLCGLAHGRSQDQSLSFILTPNNGVPAITAGEAFPVHLEVEADLKLADDAGNNYPLTVTWTHVTELSAKGMATPPSDCPPGVYTLFIMDGETIDYSENAVWIVDSYPLQYRFAHISDLHIGRAGAMEMAQRIRDAIHASEASFVLITGDLTEDASPESFRMVVSLLNTFQKPTFVVPGKQDRDDQSYEQFFGSADYAFRFGEDGYLGFDSKHLFMTDDLGAQDGFLHRAVRDLKLSRWMIGFTHRYEGMMGMRSQLLLFGDNPLHYLLFGYRHAENTVEEKTVPWGTTRISVVPAAVDGAWRLVDVGVQGVLIHPVTSVLPQTVPGEAEAESAAPDTDPDAE